MCCGCGHGKVPSPQWTRQHARQVCVHAPDTAHVPRSRQSRCLSHWIANCTGKSMNLITKCHDTWHLVWLRWWVRTHTLLHHSLSVKDSCKVLLFRTVVPYFYSKWDMYKMYTPKPIMSAYEDTDCAAWFMDWHSKITSIAVTVHTLRLKCQVSSDNYCRMKP